jgi:hypothetical protein
MLVFDFNSLGRFHLTDGIFVKFFDMSQVNVFDNVGTLSAPRGSRVGGLHQIVGLGSFVLNLKLKGWGLGICTWILVR